MGYMPLAKSLGNELKAFAEENGFRHVVNIVDRLSQPDNETLSEFDKEHVILFLKHIKITAALKYPYRNDDLVNYVKRDGEEYLEVINGIYSSFASWLYDELNLSIDKGAC